MRDFFNKEAWVNTFYRLLNKKLLILTLLGFSAGLPYLLVFGTLSAWLYEANIDNATIGFVSWVSITYAIKFLWAPFLDRIKLPVLHEIFGKRRSWLLLMQVLIFMSIYLLTEISPNDENIELFSFCALLVAFFAASQDVALDAYRIEISPKEEQGMLAAGYQFGYRMAILVSGAGALIIADNYSFEIAYKIMAALMFIGVITTIFSPEPKEYKEELCSKGDLIFLLYIDPIQDFFSRHKNVILIIILILAYRLSDLSMAPMAIPFYQYQGFTLTQIAYVAKTFGIVMSLVGVFIGGIFVLRYGPTKTLFLSTIMISSTTLMFVVMSIFGNNMNLFITTIALDNFSAGYAGTCMIAYLSSLTSPKHTATQYALFIGLLLIPGKLIAGFSGVFQEIFGFTGLFLISASLGIPAIMIAYYLNNREVKAQ
jgi:PAT family beta-lactamase induction signal transducer AmpG